MFGSGAGEVLGKSGIVLVTICSWFVWNYLFGMNDTWDIDTMNGRWKVVLPGWISEITPHIRWHVTSRTSDIAMSDDIIMCQVELLFVDDYKILKIFQCKVIIFPPLLSLSAFFTWLFHTVRPSRYCRLCVGLCTALFNLWQMWCRFV